MTLSSRFSSGLALTTLLACAGDPDPMGPAPITGPGVVSITLATPNTDDGALLLTLGGAAFDSLTSAYTMLSAESGANERRIILAGAISNGSVATFWVPERKDIAFYTATLEQVAVRQLYTQRDIQGYSLTITP